MSGERREQAGPGPGQVMVRGQVLGAVASADGRPAIRVFDVDRGADVVLPLDAVVDLGTVADWCARWNVAAPPRLADCRRLAVAADAYLRSAARPDRGAGGAAPA